MNLPKREGGLGLISLTYFYRVQRFKMYRLAIAMGIEQCVNSVRLGHIWAMIGITIVDLDQLIGEPNDTLESKGRPKLPQIQQSNINALKLMEISKHPLIFSHLYQYSKKQTKFATSQQGSQLTQ